MYCPVSICWYSIQIIIPSAENVKCRQGGPIIDFHDIIDGFMYHYYILYISHCLVYGAW